MKFSRRRVVSATGATLAALLAGCQGDGGGESTPTATGTSTASATGTPSPAALDEYEERARSFIGEIDEGSYEAAHDRFSPAAAEAISLDRLQSTWEAQEEQLGPFQSITDVASSAEGGTPTVTAELVYQNGRLRANLSFTEAGISGFRLQPVEAEWTPPAYADEDAIAERELSLPATDDCSLGATLTLPDAVAEGTVDSSDTLPGVVIVHGQGPVDRDATMGPNRTYRDLAWGLASRGVAVLRYDKRSFACEIDMAQASIDDVVTADALTAIERLRETDAVAADDVVVAGHSIGGTLAPRIAERDGNLAGIAMLAALHRPAHRAIVDQNEYLAERDGTVSEDEEASLEQVRQLAERIRTLDIADDETAYLGGEEYWRSLQEYDHEATARAIETAQLYLQGGRDWQVTVEDDFAAWQDALDGRETVTFQSYEDLNHHFMPGSGTPGPAEYTEENHVNERVVEDIVAFAQRTVDD